MRNTAWIWAVGCAAWTVDGLLALRYPQKQHAELAFIVAAAFGLAFLFYRMQKR